MKCASLKKCVCLIVTRETCCLRHEAPREAEDSDMSELIGNIYTSSISKFQRKEQGGKEQTFKKRKKNRWGLARKKETPCCYETPEKPFQQRHPSDES